ncbi:hypothetical protein FACS1894172_13140 [Spirochaetia bacterium]|nr:hypothetical protein FACS1894164_09410 [Spirochaetia bacterium]GHU33825.1 hypothetical protein FACS1894172_13140 [Spirochaetia bacterium]
MIDKIFENIIMDYMIKETAEKLLGRSLEKDDGINIEKIEEVEFILENKLPQCLRDFYIYIGNIKLFTKSFEQFFDIDKLYFKNKKLVFMEENQGVCIWGINLFENDPIVYQNTGDEDWYSEEIQLSEFIKIMMYYQCANGDENTENMDTIEIKKIMEICNGMEKIVDNNHLIIYWKNDVLLWYFTDEENKIINNSVIINGLTEEKINEFKKENGIKNN